MPPGRNPPARALRMAEAVEPSKVASEAAQFASACEAGMSCVQCMLFQHQNVRADMQERDVEPEGLGMDKVAELAAVELVVQTG